MGLKKKGRRRERGGGRKGEGDGEEEECEGGKRGRQKCFGEKKRGKTTTSHEAIVGWQRQNLSVSGKRKGPENSC